MTHAEQLLLSPEQQLAAVAIDESPTYHAAGHIRRFERVEHRTRRRAREDRLRGLEELTRQARDQDRELRALGLI